MPDENERPEAELPPMPDFLKSADTPPADPSAGLRRERSGQDLAPAAVPKADSSADTMVNYGLRESLQKGKTELSDNLKEFMDKVGDFLSKAIDDATSLEVKTYVTEDMGAVTYENKDFTGGVKLRALTRINIDGDTLVCIPEEDGELDTAVWGIHTEMTKQAQSSRTEFIKTVVQAVPGLANLLPKA